MPMGLQLIVDCSQGRPDSRPTEQVEYEREPPVEDPIEGNIG